MANFNVNGIDSLEADLRGISELSDEEKWSILESGAIPLKEKMREVIDRMFKRRTGSLVESIKISKKMKSGQIFARIMPMGIHAGASLGLRKRSRASAEGTKYHKHNRGQTSHYDGTNAEVGYYLEYGTPRIPARHWMETANEEADEESLAAMEAAWDEILKSKGF